MTTHTPGPIESRGIVDTIYECGCAGYYRGAISLCSLHAAAPEMRDDSQQWADFSERLTELLASEIPAMYVPSWVLTELYKRRENTRALLARIAS